MGEVVNFRSDEEMSGVAIREMMPFIRYLKTLAAKAVWMKLAMCHERGQLVRISVSQLARDLDVKRDTIYRAVEEIESTRLAVRRPGSGDFLLWISLENEGPHFIHRSPATGQGDVPPRDTESPHDGTASNTRVLRKEEGPRLAVDNSGG